MINNLKGGEFIGKGAYGCVYANPPLKCSGYEERSKSGISKLMLKDDSIIEKKQYIKIDNIDNKFLYHYALGDTCYYPEWPNEDDDNSWEDCDIGKKNIDVVGNLVFMEQENGGLDLKVTQKEFSSRMLHLQNRGKGLHELKKID